MKGKINTMEIISSIRETVRKTTRQMKKKNDEKIKDLLETLKIKPKKKKK